MPLSSDRQRIHVGAQPDRSGRRRGRLRRSTPTTPVLADPVDHLVAAEVAKLLGDESGGASTSKLSSGWRDRWRRQAGDLVLHLGGSVENGHRLQPSASVAGSLGQPCARGLCHLERRIGYNTRRSGRHDGHGRRRLQIVPLQGAVEQRHASRGMSRRASCGHRCRSGRRREHLPHGLAAAAAGAAEWPGASCSTSTTGQVLDHQDAFRRWYPASPTKLMTAYVTFRAIEAGELTLRFADHDDTKHAAGRAAEQDGLQARHAVTPRQRAEDDDGEVGERHRHGGRREWSAAASSAFAARMNARGRPARHDRRSHSSTPTACTDPSQYTNAARPGGAGSARCSPNSRNTASYFTIQAIGAGKKVMKNQCRLLGRYHRRGRHEDRLHLPVGLQSVASATAGRQRTDRGGVWRIRRQTARRARRGPARPGFSGDRSAERTADDACQRLVGTGLYGAARHAPLRLLGQARRRGADAPEGEAQDPEKDAGCRCDAAGYPSWAADLHRPAGSRLRRDAAGVCPRSRAEAAAALASDGQRGDVAQAFAPVDSAGDSGPAAAIGSAAGAPSPLGGVKRH